jgi:hypothetical protein
MSEFTESLREDHLAMISRQSVFFVATAAAEGRINLSPKGYDTFRVLGPDRVAWLDLGGSGNETHAHLLADGRITVMMCNFQQPALILRLYGRARPVLPADPDWAGLAAQFTLLPGTRQIFDMHVESVQSSCGWGVPVMTLEHSRATLVKYHGQQEPESWAAKFRGRTRSIDGLPVRPTDRYIAGEPADEADADERARARAGLTPTR